MTNRELRHVAAEYGAELIVQFGSTVTGTSHEKSDVDLGVLLRSAPASYAEQADLAAALAPFFPDREIDLVVLNHADPLLLKQVTEHGELLAGDPARWQEFRLLAFKRYQDHRRFFQMEREYVDRTIANARR